MNLDTRRRLATYEQEHQGQRIDPWGDRLLLFVEWATNLEHVQFTLSLFGMMTMCAAIVCFFVVLLDAEDITSFHILMFQSAAGFSAVSSILGVYRLNHKPVPCRIHENRCNLGTYNEAVGIVLATCMAICSFLFPLVCPAAHLTIEKIYQINQQRW